GTFGDPESHLFEGPDAVAESLGDGVEASDLLWAAGERDIERCLRRERFELGAAELFLPFVERAFERLLQGVGGGAKGSALVLGLVANGPEQRSDAAILSAEPLDTPPFDFFGIGGLSECGQRLLAELIH